MENLRFSPDFSTTFQGTTGISRRLFHRLWKSVWKKEVLHRLTWKTLCKSPKSPCICQKSPFFDPFGGVEGVGKLSTDLWKTPSEENSPQEPAEKLHSRPVSTPQKITVKTPQRRPCHSQTARNPLKTAKKPPILRLSTIYPPGIQGLSTKNFKVSEKKTLSRKKDPVFHSFHGA